jgi:hypothetical protein
VRSPRLVVMGVDILAIAIGIAAFAVLFFLIDAIDRI